MQWQLSGQTLLRCVPEKGDREAVVPEAAAILGADAFLGCGDIRRVTVGPQVRQAWSHALRGLSPGADILWLTRTPYRQPLWRVLPEYGRIRSLCAPYADFDRAEEEEKLLLACGFLLNPAQEACYGVEAAARIGAWCRAHLPRHLDALCARGSIVPVLLACHKRRWLGENAAAFAAYARTQVLTPSEKQAIDALMAQASPQDAAQSARNMRLLRYIHSRAEGAAMQAALAAEGVTALPALAYADTGEAAPAEALGFALYAYMRQWPALTALPDKLRLDEGADGVARALDAAGLQRALGQLAAGDGCLRHPRRLLPILRYGDEALVGQVLDRRASWRDYAAHGAAGATAAQAAERAALLSDTPPALLLADRMGNLAAYGAVRGQPESACRAAVFRALGWEEFGLTADTLGRVLPGETPDGPWARAQAQLAPSAERYRAQLARQYLRGTAEEAAAWQARLRLDPIWRAMAEGLVWRSGGCFLIEGGALRDSRGRPVTLAAGAEVALAHPMEMDEDERQRFLRRLAGKPQAILQLEEPVAHADPARWLARFEGVTFPAERLQALPRWGVALAGRPAEGIELTLAGRHLPEAVPTPEGLMTLRGAANCDYAPRELNRIVNALCDALFRELIALGRLDAAPYVNRLTAAEVAQLLRQSADASHGENTALLLERQARLQAHHGDGLDW